MADEMLRLNLNRAFDPGPGFPNPLLLSRTMAMLKAQAPAAGQDAAAAGDAATVRQTGHTKLHNRGGVAPQRLHWASTLMAVLLVLAIAATVFAARALRSHTGPVQTPPHGSRICSGNLHMVTDKVGWEGTSRTTDGGITWQNISLPPVPNFVKGGSASCELDADHVWVSESTGPSYGRPDHVVVLA